MKRSDTRRTSDSPRAPFDAPRASGEGLVAKLRLLVAALTSAFLIGYSTHTSAELQPGLAWAGLAVIFWAAISVVVLVAIRRGLYRSFISILTVICDIALVGALQWSVHPILPLHFITGPITSMYFPMIGLAALRGGRRMVILSAALAAISHLSFGGLAYHRLLPGGYLLDHAGDLTMELSFLDEVAKALGMAIFGSVITFMAKSLHDSERRYRSLFDHVPDGILITDPDGRVVTANQRFADMVGVPVESLEDRRSAELLQIEKAHERSPGSRIGATDTLLRGDGEKVPVRTATQSARFGNRDCTEMSVRDVTGQVHLEDHLARSRNMESLGRLAGGLAHDFNNLLGGIIGAASMIDRSRSRMGDEAAASAELSGPIEEITSQVESARDIIQRLLSFSRSSPADIAAIDLREILDNAASICRNTFEDKIDLNVVDHPRPAVVEGDSTALIQALLNLCINSKDAMPSGGEISLRLEEVDSGDGIDMDRVDPERDYWCIVVEDEGSGMTPEVQSRVFDPFFTTKPPGEGTGLGLSMVYSIATQHGGTATVESEPERGTTVRLYVARARTSVLPEPEDTSDLPHGSGLILLVDDDDLVRATVSGMLTELGYEVVTAAGGEAALRLHKARKGRFDLLLLDLAMPRMDGEQTLSRLRERGSNVPVLVTTGFWSDRSAKNLEKLGIDGVLRKPFSLAQLAREVAKVIGKR
ncbi:MAG: response regulator [Polyangia bacterium]